MNTHTQNRRLLRTLGALAALASLAAPAIAQAASSWEPTLLVNTESFQTIDTGDGTSDVELRFGDSTTEKLLFDVTQSRFELTRGLEVRGNLTATGSLTVSGAVILNDAEADNDTRIAGNNDSNLVFVDAGNDRVGIGTNAPSTKLDVVGTISGSIVRASNSITSSGSIAIEGSLTGATIAGFGLTDCDAANSKITWDASTQKFICSTESGDGGISQSAADDRYVNQSGDTMTGALIIDVAGEGTNALTISGTLIFNDSGLDNDARFEGVSDANLFFLDASTDRVGIGTNAPKAKLDVIGTISGSALRVSGNAEIFGTLTASGQIRTEGNLSGSTLTVDGDVTLHGQTYTFPVAQTASGFLKTDGNGNLVWSANLGNGSGDILSLHPEYPNAVYFASGSNIVGQMALSGGTVALDNSYVWTSTRGTIQDYWISVRLRVPDAFTAWDATAPLQLRYKTGAASAANNHVTVRMKDTAGADVALTGGGGLANTAWTTASITGPEAAGTWTPGGYFTIYVKLATDSTGNAAAGYLNVNWDTVK